MVFVRFLSPLLMVVLGLGAGVLLAGRRADSWRFYFAGAATFVLSQVFHIPFNGWVLSPLLESFAGESYALLLTSVLLGLSAGVFEEVARYVALRFAVRDVRAWRTGLMFGAGHGGVEAVLLGFLSLYTVMQLVTLSGEAAPVVLASVPLEDVARVQAQVAAFWALPWYAVLLGALERLFAICFHLSAALLVMRSFRRGGLAWLAAAILWHALLDASVVYVSSVWGIYWAEAALGVLTLASVGIIYALREGAADGPGGDPEPQDLLELDRVDVSREQINSSRYT